MPAWYPHTERADGVVEKRYLAEGSGAASEKKRCWVRVGRVGGGGAALHLLLLTGGLTSLKRCVLQIQVP